MKACSRTQSSALDAAAIRLLCGLPWGDIPGDRQILQFLKKSDCDEFNWLGDTYYTLLNSSLLFLAIGLTLPVAIAITSYEYFYPR